MNIHQPIYQYCSHLFINILLVSHIPFDWFIKTLFYIYIFKKYAYFFLNAIIKNLFCISRNFFRNLVINYIYLCHVKDVCELKGRVLVIVFLLDFFELLIIRSHCSIALKISDISSKLSLTNLYFWYFCFHFSWLSSL